MLGSDPPESGAPHHIMGQEGRDIADQMQQLFYFFVNSV
jgi:hypothetical protein